MQEEITRNLFAGFPISPAVRVSIVIPVRDEAENIRKTLGAFAGQIDSFGRRVDFSTFEILVLINNSSDNSAEIVKRFKLETPHINLYFVEQILPKENANIGFVRRVLMNAAFQRLRQNGGVLMTTDGDTVVAPDWIAANLREIERGADAVGGRIIITDAELDKMDAFCRATHLQDEEYRLLTAEIESLLDDLQFDSAPRHHQHFNASFACTTEVYEKSGGIPDVKFLEDCAFFDCLQRIDACVRHSPQVKVYTSSRHVGRSEIGLSFQLNLWKNLNETGADFLVESAETIVKKFQLRCRLRKIWRAVESKELALIEADVYKFAGEFCVPARFLSAELNISQPFGSLYEKVVRRQQSLGEWSRQNPHVPLEIALVDLRCVVKKFRRTAKAARL